MQSAPNAGAKPTVLCELAKVSLAPYFASFEGSGYLCTVGSLIRFSPFTLPRLALLLLWLGDRAKGFSAFRATDRAWPTVQTLRLACASSCQYPD